MAILSNMPSNKHPRSFLSHRFQTFACSVLLAGLPICSVCGIDAAEFAYPFETKSEGGATLEIHSDRMTKVPAVMLGLNCGWPEGLYGKTGYNNPAAQALIRRMRPAALRWPHGVWANFYDWESDGRRITDSYKTPYDSAVKDHPDLKYGFGGLHALHESMKFDVVFTWNINYDSPEKGVRRFHDHLKKGFNVRWIELGNETFWKTQRSEAVSDIDKYIAVTRAHAAALKKIDPAVKISVNATWREAETSEWNVKLAKERHYDAVTLHKYISHPATTEGARGTLNARREMITTAETMQRIFHRPIWLTEWSVDGGDNALSVLAMTDTWLGLLARPDLFEMAAYFQINAEQPLVLFDQKTRTHTMTSYGAAYEILRDVFQDGEMLRCETKSPELAPGLPAVSAEVVVKNGLTIVFAINKSDRPVPLRLKLGEGINEKKVVHRALAFNGATDFKTFAMDGMVLTAIPTGSGIILPPLSINRIDGLDSSLASRKSD